MMPLLSPRRSKSKCSIANGLAARSLFVLQRAVRLDDPSNNNGRGWKRLESEEVAALAYLAIRLVSRSVRMHLAGRDASKADEAARMLAEAVSRRLAAYPVFGPERSANAHSAGGERV